MMKQPITKNLFTILICMMGANAFADDISVENADGIKIYYNYDNNYKELMVTHMSYAYNCYKGNIVIPESVLYNGKTLRVTSIGSAAFKECSGLTSITIPNSITSIGREAFFGCSALTSITIPNSVTSINNEAFKNCSKLASLTIPISVTSIGSYAFEGCGNLASVTAFCNLSSWGSAPFRNCSNLKEVEFDCEIVTNLFSGLSAVEKINLSQNVTRIGDVAFKNCEGLKIVNIPNNVISIGKGAFQGSGLISVTIPNSVTYIDERVFSSCHNLASVTIPNSVTSIGPSAFSGCGNLTSVIIGSGVTSIANDAFSGTYLKKIIWLPNTPPSGFNNTSGKVNYVSNDRFSSLNNTVVYQFLSSYFDVDGIRYVPVSPSERTCDAIDCIYDENAVNMKIAPTTVYQSITMTVKSIKPYLAFNNNYIKTLTIDNDGAIPEYAFAGCSNIRSVKLSEKVTDIGSSAFQGCRSLETIDIPDNVTELKEYTFSGCSSLKDIKIKPKIKNIKNYVFYECTSLKEVNIADSDIELYLGSNGSYPIFSSCPLETIYIGRNIDYSTSSYSGYSPFYRNNSLKTVKITDKETEISENEFYGCSHLQQVIIGDGVTTISNWAFSGCSSLKFFAFGSHVQTIGKEAFSDCTAVTEISSKASVPPICNEQALDDINKWECKLYVPKGCMEVYKAADQWKDFFFTEEGKGTIDHGSGESDKKCATPTISYHNGKLTFDCASEGAEFQSTISDSDITSYNSNEVQLGVTYIISVYAMKAGYENSDVAMATLCWIDVEPQMEGITNSVAQVRAKAVVIQTANGCVSVNGLDDGANVSVYDIRGLEVGSAVSYSGSVNINTNLDSGSIAIVKIGEKSIKISMK